MGAELFGVVYRDDYGSFFWKKAESMAAARKLATRMRSQKKWLTVRAVNACTDLTEQEIAEHGLTHRVCWERRLPRLVGFG